MWRENDDWKDTGGLQSLSFFLHLFLSVTFNCTSIYIYTIRKNAHKHFIPLHTSIITSFIQKTSPEIQTAATSALTAMEAAEKRETPDTSSLLRKGGSSARARRSGK